MKKVKVITAMPLQQPEKEKVEKFIQSKSEATIEYVLDKSILGGIMIVDGETIYDGTISSQLERIQKKLSDIDSGN